MRANRPRLHTHTWQAARLHYEPNKILATRGIRAPFLSCICSTCHGILYFMPVQRMYRVIDPFVVRFDRNHLLERRGFVPRERRI
jgi:hypothetical protein